MAEMIYDFETALKTLINAQSDIMTLVQKWGEMLASDPRYITFTLKGKDGVPYDYTIPNIQMVVDTINERTLPPNPKFNSVAAVARGGTGTLTAGAIQFEGGNKEMTYDVNGIQSKSTLIADGATWELWPIPRYTRVAQGENPTLAFAPNLEDKDIAHMSDFFVFVPNGSAVTFIFRSYAQSQRMVLTAAEDSMWHVCVEASNISRLGILTTARAVKMNIINGSEA